MSRHRDWEYGEEDYAEYRKPKRVEKDKFNKHKKAIYDMIDDEEDDDYFTDDRYYDYDEE